MARSTETLGEINLIAVTGLDVLLNAFDGLAILLSAQVGVHRRLQFERRGRFSNRLTEQLNQALTFAVDQRRVKHQFAGGLLVIADQRPGVQAETCIRQLQVVQRQGWQVLQVPTEVVAQITDQTAGERQVMGDRCFT
ncbi:hypothetical protein D3C86_1357630 [compost metagenome]